MTTMYSLYFLDRSGNIQRVRRMQCPDDDEAERRAQQFKSTHGLELWDSEHDRLVKKLDPDSKLRH